MKTKHIFLFFTILILSVVSCNPYESAETPVTPSPSEGIYLSHEQLGQINLQFGEIRKIYLSAEVAAKGRLIPEHSKEAYVSSYIPGTVTSIKVKAGDKVKKGTVLATYTDPDIIDMQEQYQRSIALYEFYKAEFERQQTLNQEQVNALKTLQEAKANYEEIRATVKALKIKIEYLGLDTEGVAGGNTYKEAVMKSSISGVVNKIMVKTGSYISNNMPAFEIIDLSEMLIEIDVFEKDITHVEVGQSVSFQVSNLEEVHKGEVISLGKSVENQAKVVKVLARFKNFAESAIPGMFVSTRIHTSERETMAIPESAVIFNNENQPVIYYTVDTLKNEKGMNFIEAKIQTGIQSRDFVEIIGPDSIPQDGKIVTEGGYYIRAEKLKMEEE